jgi:hypothetical protein
MYRKLMPQACWSWVDWLISQPTGFAKLCLAHQVIAFGGGSIGGLFLLVKGYFESRVGEKVLTFMSLPRIVLPHKRTRLLAR